MMLAVLLLFGQALSLAPPADWETLPTMPLPSSGAPTPQFEQFVRNEVKAARCVLGADRTTLDMAVLVATNGRVRRIVPRAIGCAGVEQFAAGIVLRAARDTIRPPSVDTWYRTSVPLTQP